MAEDRIEVVEPDEDAVESRSTGTQRVEVVLPSDLSGPPGTGPCTVRQMTPKERKRYPPDPTKAELQADQVAGLRAPDIARKWGITLDRTWILIRYYGLYRNPAKTADRAPTTRSLREQIRAELARKEIDEKVPQQKSPAREVLTRDVLAEEIQKHSAYAIGKKYGCSDMSVRKWLKEYGLTNPRAHVETSEKTSPAPAEPPAVVRQTACHEAPAKTYRQGEWERILNQRNARLRSKPAITLLVHNVGVTYAAWESMGKPDKVSLWWDSSERRIVIKPDPAGDFRLYGYPRSLRIGGASTIGLLIDRGAKRGRYPAAWDTERGVLLAPLAGWQEIRRRKRVK